MKKEEQPKTNCVLCSQSIPFGFTVHRKFVCMSCLEVIRKLHEYDFDGVEETYFDVIPEIEGEGGGKRW